MEKQKTVLAVDDNSFNLKLVSDLLELNKFKVLKAVDGESVFGILEETVPDLIILDIHLPGISGLEVLQRIRKNKKYDGTKVLALTAQVMQEERESIKNAGFDGRLEKPFDIKAFIGAVTGIIGPAEE